MKKSLNILLVISIVFSMSSFISGDVKMEKYPDPENGILKIITPYDLGESADLKIFSSTGRIVLHEEINREILEVQVNTLSRGIYYGVLKNNYFTERFKFYKK